MNHVGVPVTCLNAMAGLTVSKILTVAGSTTHVIGQSEHLHKRLLGFTTIDFKCIAVELGRIVLNQRKHPSHNSAKAKEDVSRRSSVHTLSIVPPH